jgi:hypothetical protein
MGGPFIRPAATKVGIVKYPNVIVVGNPESVRIDETTDYQYFGYAAIGSADSGAVWKISRLTIANPQSLLWADGNASYDNVWANRLSLSYS